VMPRRQAKLGRVLNLRFATSTYVLSNPRSSASLPSTQILSTIPSFYMH
jgi:hypothetical protein